MVLDPSDYLRTSDNPGLHRHPEPSLTEIRARGAVCCLSAANQSALFVSRCPPTSDGLHGGVNCQVSSLHCIGGAAAHLGTQNTRIPSHTGTDKHTGRRGSVICGPIASDRSADLAKVTRHVGGSCAESIRSPQHDGDDSAAATDIPASDRYRYY